MKMQTSGLNGFDFFGISRGEMLNPSIIKVIDGIAGSGKSSGLHAWLKKAGIHEYLRLTSTRLLAVDAAQRYQMPVKTIASALFDTQDMLFYENPCDIADYDVIVIDEILQTSPKVFEWCIDHCGRNNIMITCDSCQCLSPFQDRAMRKTFDEFCDRQDVRRIIVKETKRAVNDKTNEWYRKAYDAVSNSDRALWRRFITEMKHSEYNALSVYDPSAVYLVYTNETEFDLYEKWDMYTRGYDYPKNLVPKGTLRGTDRDYERCDKYPIIPQINSDDARQYWQIRNISTAIRLQGTEIMPDQICYIIVPTDLEMDNRTLYTALTRCKNIDSIRIVRSPASERNHPLETFNDRLVLPTEWYRLEGDFEIEGKRIDAYIDESNTVPPEVFDEIVKMIPRTNANAYRLNAVIYQDRVVRARCDDNRAEDAREINILNLFKKTGRCNYNYLDMFYRRYELLQHECGMATANSYIMPPTLLRLDNSGRFFDDAENFYQTRRSETYQYQLDLVSAYPYIINNFPIICDGNFIIDEKASGCKLYLNHSDYFIEYAIVPDYLAQLVVRGNRSRHTEFSYLCTVPTARFTEVGRKLWEASTKSAETKRRVKAIRWGVLEQPYLSEWNYDGSGNVLTYAKHSDQNHQLIMVSIRSALAYILLRLKDCLLLDLTLGATNADSLFYDSDYTVEFQAKLIEQALPGCYFRILDNNEPDGENILYQNFDDPLTKEQRDILRKEARSTRKKEERNEAKIKKIRQKIMEKGLKT